MSARTLLKIFCAFAVFAFVAFKTLPDCEPLNASQMRTILVQLGYEVKDLNTEIGKEKYSVGLTKDGLNIPIACEISANGRYLWLTANLGVEQPDNASKNYNLLKQNGIVQPAQFYITEKGKIMMGLPLENKGITNSYLREKLESIASKVGQTKSYWQ